MSDVFHVFDGNRWFPEKTLEEAKAVAHAAIVIAQDCCDPEWPDWASQIGIYAAPADCELPDEDGTLLWQARETNIRDADEGSGCDYFCDYALVKADIAPTPTRKI
jgi:hypothetical protein